jgi:hypothetical protein
LVATGGKTVGLVLVVPTMVYTLLINCLQVANSIWGKWPNQNPPQVTYVSGLDGLLVPTIAYPQYVSPFSQFCPLQKMDDWAEACAETTTDGSPLDDMRNMLKCMHDRGDFLGCDANAGAWLENLTERRQIMEFYADRRQIANSPGEERDCQKPKFRHSEWFWQSCVILHDHPSRRYYSIPQQAS